MRERILIDFINAFKAGWRHDAPNYSLWGRVRGWIVLIALTCIAATLLLVAAVALVGAL